MIGSTLKGLRKLFIEIGGSWFPKITDNGLTKLTEIRSWLAHSYLVDNSRAMLLPDAHNDPRIELPFSL
jgi:hypothetical protein